MAYAIEKLSGSYGIAGRFAALRENLALLAARRRAYRTTFVELSNLSDRELYDLGLSRQSIKTIAQEAAEMI